MHEQNTILVLPQLLSYSYVKHHHAHPPLLPLTGPFSDRQQCQEQPHGQHHPASSQHGWPRRLTVQTAVAKFPENSALRTCTGSTNALGWILIFMQGEILRGVHRALLNEMFPLSVRSSGETIAIEAIFCSCKINHHNIMCILPCNCVVFMIIHAFYQYPANHLNHCEQLYSIVLPCRVLCVCVCYIIIRYKVCFADVCSVTNKLMYGWNSYV